MKTQEELRQISDQLLNFINEKELLISEALLVIKILDVSMVQQLLRAHEKEVRARKKRVT